MNREIPGFYYDADRKRYFKIESHHTASANAANTSYNVQNVKKRKADELSREQLQKRHEKLKERIKPSRILTDPLLGGRLQCEFGFMNRETPVVALSSGLRYKGDVSFVPGQIPSGGPNIPCMLVNGDDDQSGMAVIYATVEGQHLLGSYIPTDKADRINFNADPLMRPERLYAPQQELFYFEQITSISYHAASHNVIVTATNNNSTKISVFSPPLSDDDGNSDPEKPKWLLGESNHSLEFNPPQWRLSVHATRPAPASYASHMVALFATNRGLLRLSDPDHTSHTVHWIGSKRPGARNHPAALEQRWRPRAPTFPPDQDPKPLPTDVLSVDFLSPATNPHVILAGCRDAKFFRIDMRTPVWQAGGWEWFRHQSSVAHLRAVNEHQVLAAGPRSAMALYDVRWMATRGQRAGRARPVIRMGEYRNEAHVQIGLDIDAERRIAAAAMDDGSVGLFSLLSGRRLKSEHVDSIRARDVVKTLQFEKMPWERETSLWIGQGPTVRKFSFGKDADEE